MGVNLNKEQAHAVNSNKKEIIVSAGAGSGKTEVLKQRVKRLLDDGINLEQIILITFTNASAFEMRERISQIDNAKNQISNANIMTFDAFFLQFVKRFGYLINIKDDISIIDDFIYVKKLREIIINVLNDYANNKEEHQVFFDLFLNQFSDLEMMLEFSINLIKHLDNKPDYKIMFEEQTYLNIIDLYNQEFNDFFASLPTIIKNFDLEDNKDAKKIMEFMNTTKNLNIFEKQEININDKYKLHTCLANLFKDGCIDKNDYKEVYKYISRFTNHLSTTQTNLGITPDFLSMHKALYNQEVLSAFYEFVKTIQTELYKFKLSINKFTYNDIALMVLDILKIDNEELKNYLTNIKEIMVDEFQDTNQLQNEITDQLTKYGASLFLVGDSKQSIYGFRYATPYYFNQRIEKCLDEENKDNEVIYLNTNYRSNPNVLHEINDIFNVLMTKENGEIDYKDSHALIDGKKVDNDNSKIHKLIINNEDVKGIDEGQNFKHENLLYSTILLGKYINELHNQGVKYGDIGVLVTKKSKTIYMDKIFNQLKIPFSAQKDSNLEKNQIFLIVRSILNLILNEDVRYHFYAILRSFLYEIEEQELTNFFKDSPRNNHEFINYIKTSKYGEIYNIIETLKNDYQQYNAHFLIIQIFNKFPFSEKLSSIKLDINFEEIFQKIVELFSICDNEDLSLVELLHYFNNPKEIKYPFLAVNQDNMNENSVKIMTIHKSKGLQFKHVILFELASSSSNQTSNMFDDYFNFKYPDSDSSKTLISSYNKLINIDHEKIRLFYVACTRAEEQLTIFQTIGKNDKGKNFNDILNQFNIESKDLDILPVEEYTDLYFNKHKNNNEDINNIANQFQQHYFEVEKIQKSRPSRSDVCLLTKENKHDIQLGDYFHRYLSTINYQDLDNINENNQELNNILNLIRKCDLFKNIKNYYQEVEFFDSLNNIHGTIDLILIDNDDNVKIIDYKLKNLEKEAYIRQLNYYRDFLEKHLYQKVNCYLYSLVNGNYIEITK